jgi:hypothetical protein
MEKHPRQYNTSTEQSITAHYFCEFDHVALLMYSTANEIVLCITVISVTEDANFLECYTMPSGNYLPLEKYLNFLQHRRENLKSHIGRCPPS